MEFELLHSRHIPSRYISFIQLVYFGKCRIQVFPSRHSLHCRGISLSIRRTCRIRKVNFLIRPCIFPVEVTIYMSFAILHAVDFSFNTIFGIVVADLIFALRHIDLG